jgi:phosphoserine phosphatase RsbU/P
MRRLLGFLVDPLTVGARSALRWELAGVAIGVVLLSVSLAGLALFLFRRRSRDLSLIYFSSFSLLYAIRLLAREGIIRSLFPDEVPALNILILVIDCAIIVPLTLFLIQLVDARWQTVLRWVLAVQAAFGAARLLAAGFGVGQKIMSAGNNVLVLASCSLLAFHFISARSGSRAAREIKIVFAGLAVFVLFVIQGNLADLRLLPGQNRDNIEPIGFLIFVGCLGYVAAHRTVANEERLFAIGKELEIARQIQSSILPREIPRLAGLEIAARYVPMSAVAGDFYDFLRVDDNGIGILVADVTGHGVPAALIASMLKVAFAGQSAHAENPARVLAGVNRALCGKFEEHFVTAAYVFVDSQRSILRYAGAGHPPLLFASNANAHVREIEENGLMLGLFPDAAYQSTEIKVSAGDRCLLYTDGIVEAHNAASEEFSKQRLKEFLETHRQIPGGRLTDDLLAEIARWSNGASAAGEQQLQGDDITVLVLDFHSAR